MKVCLLLKRPLGDARSPVVNELAEELQRRNISLSWILPRSGFIDLNRLTVDSDLYVFRTSMPLVLSLGSILHDRGAHLVNSVAASSFVRDKARTTAALMAAGFPVPKTCFAGDARTAVSGFGNVPIVIKPPHGSGGRGVEVVHTEADIHRINGGPHFAQTYDRCSPYDLKVFVIDEEVFVVRRQFPALTMEQKHGELCACDAAIERLARGVGRLLGLEVFGLDLVESSCGPVIVDVNSCPGLIGVPNAARRLANYIAGQVC